MEKLFDLKGKTALVTGGSRGIGAMIAEGFVRRGVRTYIASRKGEDCTAAAARLCRYGECIGVRADLATRDGIDRLAAELRDKLSGLDILVNNAGSTWGDEIDVYPESGWDKVMTINVKTPFYLTQALLPLLEASASPDDPARVIIIGSVDGIHVSSLPTFAYGPSKAAAHHLARTLAAHLAARYITVNAIAPGLFPSKMTAATIEKNGDRIVQATPLKRMGRPDDMAGVAIYLASRAGSFVTGTIIPVDGGITGATGAL